MEKCNHVIWKWFLDIGDSGLIAFGFLFFVVIVKHFQKIIIKKKKHIYLPLAQTEVLRASCYISHQAVQY